MCKLEINIKNKEFKTVLFLHGWYQTKESLRCLEEKGFEKYNTILLDLPPFGEAHDIYLYGVDNYLQYLNKLLDINNIKVDMIVAHSFGGKIAIEYALKHQDIPLLLYAPSIIKPSNNLIVRVRILLYKFYKLLYRYRIVKHIPMRLKGSNDYRTAQENDSLKRTFLSIVNEYYDKQLKRINSKVSIVYGMDDNQISLSQMKRAVKNLKNGNLAVIKGNHFAFRRDVDFFLERLESLESK